MGHWENIFEAPLPRFRQKPAGLGFDLSSSYLIRVLQGISCMEWPFDSSLISSILLPFSQPSLPVNATSFYFSP